MVLNIPEKHERALRHVQWEKITDYILRFLKGQTKQTPRIVRLYGGKENYEDRQGKLFVYGREVVIDKKRKQEIINKAEEDYGGLRKAANRLNRFYFNITRNDVRELFKGSERRQLKARQQKVTRTQAFIAANRPGTLQVDLTFYRASNIPVFGAVDVFSRYAYYERVPNKRADVVVKAMQNCLAHFKKVMHKDRRVVKVSSDAGVEFQAEFKAFLKKQKIFYDKQVRARKMIESLNRTLRRYIERVGWDTLKELDELIEKFVQTYNQSKHTTTKKAPIDLINVEEDAEVKEADKQYKAGKKRMDKKGFVKAELKVGDTVRIYDPKRVEIKAKQKEALKGKIKLSNDDYVKQYTSKHRGQEPHWTKTVYIIERVMGGKRAKRYLLIGKKGAFMRSELQRVSKITKEDPRRAKKAAQQKEKDKLLARRPPPVRYAKYIDKYVYFNNENAKEQRGLTIEVYKDLYLLVVSRNKLYIISKPYIVRGTNDKYMATKERQKYEAEINNAQKAIDDYLDGTDNKLPTHILLPAEPTAPPKPAPKAKPPAPPKPKPKAAQEPPPKPKPKPKPPAPQPPAQKGPVAKPKPPAPKPKPKPAPKPVPKPAPKKKKKKSIINERCIFLWDDKPLDYYGVVLEIYKKHYITYFMDPDGEWLAHMPFADLHKRLGVYETKSWARQVINDNLQQIDNAKNLVDEGKE